MNGHAIAIAELADIRKYNDETDRADAFLDDDDIWMENKVQRQIDIVGGDVDELFYGRNQIACYKAGKEQKV